MAVQHAHSRGVLHRDLKPSNILLARRGTSVPLRQVADDVLLESWVPKVADFSLAKLLESEGDETQTGLVFGTAPYMAPEQLLGRTREIGVHTDVYALGAVLYEVLTGRPPFRAASPAERRQHIDDFVVSPRQLRPDVPRDLENICLKCLASDYRKRYVTAAALADDLQRFLEGEPVQARPVSVSVRVAKWLRRRPAIASALVVAFIALAALSTTVVWHYRELARVNQDLTRAVRREEQETHEAELQKRRATQLAAGLQRHLYISNIRLIEQLAKSGERSQLTAQLNTVREGEGHESVRGFEWYFWWHRCRDDPLFVLPGQQRYANAVTFFGRRASTGDSRI